MPDILVNEKGWSLTPPTGKKLVLGHERIVCYIETVDHAQFTDGGAAVGTYDLKHSIPAGAHFLGADVLACTGFAGDTSAVLTIGDGTDVDRYNTGTPSVFADAAHGVAMGIPSGVLYHAADKTPKLTITTNADFSSVSAGEVTVVLHYLVAEP